MEAPLLVKKRVLKAQVTRLVNKFNDETIEISIHELNIIVAKINSLKAECKSIFDEIFLGSSDENFDEYMEEFVSIDEKLDDIHCVVKGLIEDGVRDRKPVKGHEGSSVRLPKLSLPTFSGKVEEWMSFHDLFKASVDDNSHLSPAQKLQYLKSACTGDALRVIQSISISDDNYKIARTLLKERFSNKRVIIQTIMNKILTIPPIIESSGALLNLVDSINEWKRSLESLDQNVVGLGEVLILHIISEKLPRNTRSWWERTLKREELGEIEGFLSFLTDHARSLGTDIAPKEPRRNTAKITSLVVAKANCLLCGDKHNLYACQKFLDLQTQDRVEYAKREKLCFNCLSQTHMIRECQSTRKCKKCRRSHHTLLHLERNELPTQHFQVSSQPLSPLATSFSPRNTGSEPPSTDRATAICAGAEITAPQSHVLLCTAIVKVKDVRGVWVSCRALLDTGSQASFISEECIARLGLPRSRKTIRVSSLGTAQSETGGDVELVCSPHFPSAERFTTRGHIVKKITSLVPSVPLPSSLADVFGDMVLADPSFRVPGKIDLLLGVNVFLSLLKGEVIKRGDGLPFAVATQLGWIISGTAALELDSPASSVQCHNVELGTDEIVKRFWALDSVPNIINISKIDQKCEEHFKSTHYRGNGRYVVRLPLKESPSKLGKSRDVALKRFLSLERRLAKTPATREMYKSFMDEYLRQGHMELVDPSTATPPVVNYIPHHGVIKNSSTTTKLRVVFNASAKTSSGYSLNDLLMTGPRIQQELFPILLRFRNFPVVVTADIEKMFRQIGMHPEDRDLQRIIWRNDSNDPIKEYKLTTVTYGTASAPFLATRAIHQLALDEETHFSLASSVALTDFYVDDLLTGASSAEECKKLVTQLIAMMSKGVFTLRKWSSNVPSVLECVPSNLRDEVGSIDLDNESVKILGIKWNPGRDYFHFTVALEPLPITKRTILSDLARIFDPLGWLSPCTVFIKILIQELWKTNLSWDDPVCESLEKKWVTFRKELTLLEQLRIPRLVSVPQSASCDIHAFCDASEKAYSAAIYVWSTSANSKVRVNLLTAKTRVAPLKVQSLPRLELCAAVLCADLLQVVLKYFETPVRNIIAWSDSTVALSWISSEPYRWVPFVANRVAKIQGAIPQVKWRHVKGIQNPADCATRGMLPSEFIQSNSLWFGPEWLNNQAPDLDHDAKQPVIDDDAMKEQRTTYSLVAPIADAGEAEILDRFSSWTGLRRVVALCLRFRHNCANPGNKRLGVLSSDELTAATTVIVRSVQRAHFPQELACLIKGNPLGAHNKILPLAPFLDEAGVIRVGGRLRNSPISSSQKHPILLPHRSHVTEIIIRHYHLTYLHAAQTLLLSVLRTQFWVIAGRSAVRQMVHQCVICVKTRAKLCSQLMGDLPPARVQPSRPFTNTGTDYAGPYLYKPRAGRGTKSFKCYVAVFVCFATKAVHLELVSDLTSTAFIAALKRFIARRGKPSQIISDNGTNFKGASKELKDLYRSVSNIEQGSDVSRFSADEGMEWKFNPPSAPHFGGLWEACVKSLKFHLRRVMGAAIYTYEEFSTLLTQVEACLNSRPLCTLSSDPNDPQVLTPGHFLIGAPLIGLPEMDVTDISTPRLTRWQLVQKAVQLFWKRWSVEYLSTLQNRSKWVRPSPDIKTGDLVIVKNELLHPTQWKVGRVTKVHPGSDGRVRVVTVYSGKSEFTRPIRKLCLLPTEN